jgi:hypothetical protein
MPAGRQLPAVTKNRNYPQPVKHLKPAALARPPAGQASGLRKRNLIRSVRTPQPVLYMIQPIMLVLVFR